MNNKKKHTLSSIGKNLTATVSVSLVLLILGIVGTMAIATRNVTNAIKENIGFNLTLKENVSDDAIDNMKRLLADAPYVATYEYFSAEEILIQEEEILGTDVVQMLGVNPYQPEFAIKVKADYANSDSINRIIEPFQNNEIVSEVNVHTQMVDAINSNIRTLSMVLLAVAVALLIISFVLINNTVRLTIYSRRFLLHTMQLVGATAGFIRRPILISNIVNGLIAGALAIVLLLVLRYYAASLEPDVQMAIPTSDMFPVFGGMLVGGMLICALASIFATNKYLRQSYDDLF